MYNCIYEKNVSTKKTQQAKSPRLSRAYVNQRRAPSFKTPSWPRSESHKRISMLQKQYRLKKRKQFNYIYKHGRNAGCDCLTLVYNYCRLKNIKIGFSASKKVGNSVKRHRAVRLMREAIRPLVPRMAENHNYIFVAKDIILEKSFDEIKSAVEQVLKKAGLLKWKTN